MTPDRSYPTSGVFPEEEDTASGKPLSSMPPLPDDVNEAIGVLMATLARQGRHLENIRRELGMLRTEIVGLRKDVHLDRGELVRGASQRASNRVAALMGAVFTLYELGSPYLHAIGELVSRLVRK